MAAAEMYDYLPDAIPDVSDELDCRVIMPTAIGFEEGDKNTVIIEGDDESEERIVISTQSIFIGPIQWLNLTRDEAGTIFDLYHSTSKACGEGNAFYLIPPTNYDGHTYVARFIGKFKRIYRENQIWDVFANFKILGRKPD